MVRSHSRITIPQIVFAARPLELIQFLRKQHVEARQRSVAAADVALQLDFDIFREIGGVDLLLERPQAVPQHDDLVEERLDRPGLFLELRVAGAQDQRSTRHFSAGATGVMPVSSRMIRRSSISISISPSGDCRLIAGPLLSRSLTIGSASRRRARFGTRLPLRRRIEREPPRCRCAGRP